MYNVNVKEAIERLIGYVEENAIREEGDGLINICLHGSNIRSLEEIGYLLTVERIRNFDCSVCKNLKDLRGSPREVSGNFICYWCSNLESLEGGSKYIKGNFYSNGCHKLMSLGSSIKVVEGDFFCSNCNNLKEIKFDIELIGKRLICTECENLEYIDSNVVRKVVGKIYIRGCKNIKNISELKKEFGDKIDRRKIYV